MIAVDATKLPGWQKLEFFDDARSLGEVTAGTTQLTATDLKTGFHVLSVIGTADDGQKRSCVHVLIVVRKPPGGGH